ncbi:MAG: hypothetical protein Q8K60_02630, partial [Parachlamydiaceae bacterium]|nr:hypothetical protein [Parachlamydiaceae bacterium]
IGNRNEFSIDKINEILAAALKNNNLENCFISFSLCVSLQESRSNDELKIIKKNLFRLLPLWLEQKDEKFIKNIKIFVEFLNKTTPKPIKIPKISPESDEEFKNTTKKTFNIGNWIYTNTWKFGCGATFSLLCKGITWNKSSKLNFINSIFWNNRNEYYAELIEMYELSKNFAEETLNEALPFSLTSILSSQCPREEFYVKLKAFLTTEKVGIFHTGYLEKLSFREAPTPFLKNVILESFLQELIYNHFFQSSIFNYMKNFFHIKTKGDEVILAFASIMIASGTISFLSEGGVDVNKFIIEMGFGILHQFGGTPISFGARMMHRFSVFSTNTFLQCYPSMPNT